MTDRVVDGACSACESVAVHTRKIYSSCRDKDCIEDLYFYPTVSAEEVLATTSGLRGGSAELVYVLADVEPVSFNRGYYAIDIGFYYRVTLQAATATARYTEIEGLCVFSKRIVLYGGEGGAQVFTSAQAGASTLPTAVVEAVSPLILEMKLLDSSGGSPEVPIINVPTEVSALFSEPLVLTDTGAARRAYVTLGQFSIVRLERDTQLLIPVYDYSIPTAECTDGEAGDDPCEMFDNVAFPVDAFFPSSRNGEGGCACGCE